MYLLIQCDNIFCTAMYERMTLRDNERSGSAAHTYMYLEWFGSPKGFTTVVSLSGDHVNPRRHPLAHVSHRFHSLFDSCRLLVFLLCSSTSVWLLLAIRLDTCVEYE
jgi:hypothetical protein